jgi:hypothetical protein
MSTRWLVRSIAALCVLALPSVAAAQSASPLSRALSSTPIVSVILTQDGTFATPTEALMSGLGIVDRQSADLDGDGDEDVLAFVDLLDGASVTGRNAGRGAVVFFREGEVWRGRTVASVPAIPYESAYNWGEVTAHRRGTNASPTIRLFYSAAYRGRFAQTEYRIRFDREGMHVLHGPGSHTARTSSRTHGRGRPNGRPAMGDRERDTAQRAGGLRSIRPTAG